MSSPTVLSDTDSPCAMGDRRATGSISVVTNVNVAAASTNSRIAVADGRVSVRAGEGTDVIAHRIYSAAEEIMTIVSDPRSRAGEVLAAIHARPGIARAQLTEQLGLSSGLASDLVASLVAGRWLSEGEPRPRAGAGRGRPTRALWAHPDGPPDAAVR